MPSSSLLSKERNKNWRKNIKWLVIFVSAVFTLTLVLSPLKNAKADHYLYKGDQFLANKKYISAMVEYKKSQYLSNEENVNQRIELANKAQEDVLMLEGFLREFNDHQILDELAKAKSVPSSEYDALVLAKQFLENEQPQLAILAAITACEMDRDYRDAWLYLGISHFMVVQSVELNTQNKQYHLDQARSALAQAKELDANYQPTIDYINQVTNLNF